MQFQLQPSRIHGECVKYCIRSAQFYTLHSSKQFVVEKEAIQEIIFLVVLMCSLATSYITTTSYK